MVLALESAELQIRCNTLPSPAWAAFVSVVTLTSASLRQPRQFNFRGNGLPNSSASWTEGADNKLGQYYAWNRTYDINTGRWTTPDPVASPFWNLVDYCYNQPTQLTDPAGLFVPITSGAGYLPQSTGAQLSIKTVAFNIGVCGEFAWNTKWQLSEGAASTSGSDMEKTWVVQIVARKTVIDDCNGGKTETVKWITEAWEVEPGKTETMWFGKVKDELQRRKNRGDRRADPDKAFDDIWQDVAHPNTRGSTTMAAFAFLMRGHQLPSFMQPDRSQPFGDLHGVGDVALTPVMLLMMGGGSYASSMIGRSLFVEWDCCDSGPVQGRWQDVYDQEKYRTKGVKTTGVPVEGEGRLKGGPKVGGCAGHGYPPVEDK